MQRAAINQHWAAFDDTDDARAHPLRSRLARQPEPAEQPQRVIRPPVHEAPAAAQSLGPVAPPTVVRPAVATARAAPAKAKPSPPSFARRAGSAAGYGVLGFILGAVFWHFVGFWDFVGQVMFRGPATEHQITQAPAPVKLKERIGGAAGPLAVVIEPEACTTLQLDRDSGVTSEVPCEAVTLPLRSLRLARKEDLWVTASQRIQQATSRGWAMVTVEAPGERTGTVAAAD